MDSNIAENEQELATPPTRPPVVLQILPSLVTGGVERGAVDIAAALAGAGWTSLVASAGGPMVREIERAGATHITLPVDSKNPIVIAANVGRLRRVIAERNVDIVHARSRAPAWSAWLAARRSRRPFITTFHGTYGAETRFKLWYNSVMARGDRVIAISNFIATHMIDAYGADPDRIRVIPRGIDLGVFDAHRVSPERIIQLAVHWRLPDGAPVVMLPGRLTRWKGQSVLLEAMAKLKRPDVVCVIVGSDQGRTKYRTELQATAERLGIGFSTRIVDDCRDMPAALLLATVVVSASTDPEAFGRVIAEAQAMGRPVIASDHGGARETVIPGETGWLVPPGDADALAQAIDQALSLREDGRLRLAETAIAHVHERFSKEAMCQATLDVYAELLNDSSA